MDVIEKKWGYYGLWLINESCNFTKETISSETQGSIESCFPCLVTQYTACKGYEVTRLTENAASWYAALRQGPLHGRGVGSICTSFAWFFSLLLDGLNPLLVNAGGLICKHFLWYCTVQGLQMICLPIHRQQKQHTRPLISMELHAHNFTDHCVFTYVLYNPQNKYIFSSRYPEIQ